MLLDCTGARSILAADLRMVKRVSPHRMSYRPLSRNHDPWCSLAPITSSLRRSSGPFLGRFFGCWTAAKRRAPTSADRPGLRGYTKTALYLPRLLGKKSTFRDSGSLTCSSTRRYETGGGGDERTHLLLALVVSSLTTHPFRDGAPLLLLIETPPIFGRSLRFLHILHRKRLLILSPSYFAACGHHLLG